MKHTLRFLVLSIVALALGASTGEALDPSDLDPSFNSPLGYAVAIRPGYDDYATDTVTTADGAVLVAASVETSHGATGMRPAVFRFGADGLPDISFGSLGMFEVPVDLSPGLPSLVQIALDASGNIYLSYPALGGTPVSRNFFLSRVERSVSVFTTSSGTMPER